MTNDMFLYENQALSEGAKLIAGVDEVGRGPLAGDLVVAAVIMDLNNIVEGVNDSKKLSAKKRERLFDQIVASAVAISIVHKTPQIIDQINILNATKQAMSEAVAALETPPDVVLVDAVKIESKYPTIAIIGGDARSYSIACASIIAKVTRDRIMDEMDNLYPQYGFVRNKGYGTAEHIGALRAHGATPLHRRSFIRNFVEAD